MATHFLPLSKTVLHIYTPRQTSVPNSMRIGQKLRKYIFACCCFRVLFAMQDLPPFFAHNIWLPWQHTFCHCQKLCLAHLHPKANICAEFHENRSKTEVRNYIFACCCFSRVVIFARYFRGSKAIREIRENKTTAKISARTVVRDARFPPIFCP